MTRISLSLLLLLLWSCNGGNETVENQEGPSEIEEINNGREINCWISGEITGAVNQPVSLEVVGEQGELKLASTVVKSDGTFELESNVLGLGMYQLKLGLSGNKIIPLTLVPGNKVKIKATFETFERLPVFSGTNWSKSLTGYMSKFNDFAMEQMEMSKNKGLTQDQQIEAFLAMRKPLDSYAKLEMDKDPANPANLVLMTSLTPVMGFENWDESNLETLKKVSVAYGEKYNASPMAKSVQKQVMEIESGLKDYQLTVSGQKEAPEISLPNPAGKTIKLSSLKGKIVLIDFWASWCAPCRRENPNVVRLYNKYKSKGFTVYSVSLDADAAAWERAIKADGLVWPNHVSDLKQWNTPLTGIYGFNSIPYTVLIDKEGKIIATNLRGAKLEQKLRELL